MNTVEIAQHILNHSENYQDEKNKRLSRISTTELRKLCEGGFVEFIEMDENPNTKLLMNWLSKHSGKGE